MKSYKELLGFDDKWLVIIGAPIVALLMSSMMFADVLVTDLYLFSRGCLLVGFIYVVIYWLTFRQVFILFRRRFPNTEQTVWPAGSPVWLLGFFDIVNEGICLVCNLRKQDVDLIISDRQELDRACRQTNLCTEF